jgi:8-oxo-dGTP pyrophosphatase MutT (NUDIX family)
MNKKILAFIFDGNKFLALRNNSKDPAHGGDFWFTVTGSLEKGESREDVIRREVKEETSLNIIKIFDLNWGSVYSWNNQDHEEKNFIAFVKKEKIVLNEEHVDFEWLNLDEFVKRIKWDLDKEELKAILKFGIKRKKIFPFTRIDSYFQNEELRTIFMNGKNKTILSWHESDDFSKMKNVRQCYGICFDNKNRIMIVSNKKDKWFLPGGTPEKGETFEQTLIRELDEEADIGIDNIIPLGYNKIEEFKEGKRNVFYQLRYIAKIKKIKRQTIDPATNTQFERKFINPQDFLAYTLWGRPGEEMIKDALDKYVRYIKKA